MDYRAWIAKAAKQPLVLDTIDLGPLGPEEVEVAVEHCGVCHSDLSGEFPSTPRFSATRPPVELRLRDRMRRDPRANSRSALAGTPSAACTVISACQDGEG